MKLELLKKFIKKKLIILCLILTPPITSISQNTVEITSDQLRTANMIFAEHEKMSNEIPLLKRQIKNLEQADSNWMVVDSLREAELNLYNIELKNKEESVKKLQDDLNKKSKITKCTIIGSLSAIILCLFLK